MAEHTAKHEPIAIIGMSSALPGGANVDESWEMIRDGLNQIRDTPNDRLDVEAYYNPDKGAKDKIYCKRGGFLSEFDFNPREFGLNMFQMEDCDCNQTLSLLKVKEALEDANIEPFTKEKKNIGVVIGLVGGQKSAHEFQSRMNYPVLEKVLRNMGLPEEDVQAAVDKYKANFPEWRLDSFPGMLSNVTAGRCTNTFNLDGMNCVVDAACASSLISVKVAIDELLYGDCRTMICGATCTDNGLAMFMSFSKTPVFSTMENISPFERTTKGMLIGEGSVMFVLKKLEHAIEDGDRIHALIRGCASSSDGKASGIYTPTVSGQEQCIRRALRKSGVDPSTISLVEAHGTGTPVGDKLELTALKNVLQEGSNTEKESVAVGSIKSQIGHTKAVAGAAGMVKTVLALMHKTLPISINCKNPPAPLLDETDIHDSPIYINTKTRPWFTKPGVPRRAGISSFGFGGANYHCILEEYEHEHEVAYRLNRTPRSVVFAAPTLSELVTKLASIRNRLLKEISLDEFCMENALGSSDEKQHQYRAGFVVGCKSSAEQCAEQLAQLAESIRQGSKQFPEGGFFAKSTTGTAKLAVVFPSENDLTVHQYEELALNWPTFRQEIEAGDVATARSVPKRLSQVLYPRNPYEEEFERETVRQKKELAEPQYARTCTVATSLGAFKVFEAAGLSADFATGYGAGKLAARTVLKEISRNAAYKEATACTSCNDDPAVVTQREIGRFMDKGATHALVFGRNVDMPNRLTSDVCIRVDQTEISVHRAAVRLYCHGFNFSKKFDPFAVYRTKGGAATKKSKTTLKLSATTYVAPKTLKARESILNDGKLLSRYASGQTVNHAGTKMQEQKESLLSQELQGVKAEVASLRQELSSLKAQIAEGKRNVSKPVTKITVSPPVEVRKMEQLYEELLKIYESYP